MTFGSAVRNPAACQLQKLSFDRLTVYRDFSRRTYNTGYMYTWIWIWIAIKYYAVAAGLLGRVTVSELGVFGPRPPLPRPDDDSVLFPADLRLPPRAFEFEFAPPRARGLPPRLGAPEAVWPVLRSPAGSLLFEAAVVLRVRGLEIPAFRALGSDGERFRFDDGGSLSHAASASDME